MPLKVNLPITGQGDSNKERSVISVVCLAVKHYKIYFIITISLHFSVSLAPFEFVPLKLIVEPDVSANPKCQDQISGRLFYGSGRLGTSPDMVNPLLSPRGLFISKTFGREEGLI